VNWNVERSLSSEVNRDFSSSWDQKVSAIIDITKGVSSNDNWLGPVFDKTRHIADEDWLSEHCSIEIVSYSSIGTLPHLFKFEFLDSCFVRSNGSALDADLAFFNGIGRFDGNLVISFISVLDA